ncbi:uncharacterized protein LOC132746895 [Ruditapes philippinarum]|uniref:uncharacterized protein LOC132746895 n=1 Tax=Ruditapes philippinarum TaxID=129788 RepID=UPI00295A5C6A|nr:uncharacterized protein LOC132746895 [Ruditapes philippinarum]
MSNNDDASECQSLSTDALPMAPRQLPEDSSQPIPPRANEENQDEPSSTEHLQQPTQSPFNLPNPPTDWNFNIFLNKIAESLTMEDLVNMKWFFEGEGGLGKGVLEKIKTPQDLFRILRTRGYITRDNLLYLQGILYQAGRKDLIQDGVEYAKSLGNVVHFYAPTYLPENGYKHVKFHVDGMDFQNYSRDDVENLRRKVSAILFVPQQFVFICGIEPSSSLVITLMIPDLNVEILKEMLEKGDVLSALHGTGVDLIDLGGQKPYTIKSTGDTNTVESEQEMKLVNVYGQLQQTKERLDTSEMTCIDLYRQIDDMQQTIDKTAENLRTMENEIFGLKKVLSVSADGKEPASLNELSSLTEFTESLHHCTMLTIDRKVVQRMIDATVNIVSSRMRKSHRIREQSFILSLQDMESQVVPLKFEIERFKFLDSLSNIDKSVLDKIQEMFQPVIGQVVQISLTPIGAQMVTKISSKLRHKEKEKLKLKYQWIPNGDIEMFMEQNPNLFLAGIFYKEMATKKMNINFETFLAQCLSEVGREDLKKYLEPKHYQSPQSAKNSTEPNQKPDADAQWRTYPQQGQRQHQGQQQQPQQQQHQQEQQQHISILINRMSQQIDEMYNMLQTSQKMYGSKFDDWKTPSFASNFFQQQRTV